MKKNFKPIILASAAALAFGGIAVGTTFALFTSKAETSIDVKSGKIDLKADVKIDNAWELGNVPMTKNSDYEYTSSIGASISKDEYNVIHLNKLAPGDGAKFSFDLDNSGTNINTKQRLFVSLQGELSGALEVEVKLGDVRQFALKGEGTSYTTWENVNAFENPNAYTVTINFPDGDNGEILFGNDNNDNQYQNKEAVLVLGYEAIQGNAYTDDTLEAINTRLGTARYLEGANNTMHDALLDLDASQIEAIKERGYVYGTSSDQFYNFVNTPADAYKYFKIYEAMPETQNYSIYAVGEGWTDINNLTVGLDVGDVTTISNITYDRHDATDAQNVVIRTNSFDTNLTINAPKDTVKHYDKAGSLNIIAVDSNNSYHEFGTIYQKAQIDEGRLVVESTGNIPLVEVTAVPTTQAPVKVETSKDIVVTVSNAVATSLGENKLPNTEIKVSNTQANVTVDAVVEASSVEINGTPATTEDLKSVYKATTVAEIESAPAGSYVMLMNDLGPGDMPYEVMDFGFMVYNNPRYIKLNDITLDLNGHTIESDRITAVDVSNKVEILDSSLDKNGQIIQTGKGSVEDGKIFYVNNNATLIISGGTFTSTQGDGIYVDRRLNSNIIINGGIISAHVYGVVLTPQNGVAYLTINGGTITSQTDYAITGNGLNDGTVININGGEISSPKTAIYHPQNGVLNITGGTISGSSAVEMRAGTLTVSGNAVLRGDGTYYCEANGNGHTTTGAALAIAQHTTKKDINVTINGGEFVGEKAVAISNPQENNTTNVTITINGGTFSGDIYKNPDNASAWTLTDNR